MAALGRPRCCRLQRSAIQLFPAFALLCLQSPVDSLILGSPAAVGWEPDDGEEDYDDIDPAQLDAVGAIQQLRSLRVEDLSKLSPSLCSTIRHLSALTSLYLAACNSSDGLELCAVFSTLAAIAQLRSLCVIGSNDCIQRLPTAMSSLTRLRELEIRNIRILQSSPVLTAFTALERLSLRQLAEQHSVNPQQQNPLPAGMHALLSLRSLSVTCYYQPMPPLDLPSLQELELSAPSFGGQVCAACRLSVFQFMS